MQNMQFQKTGIALSQRLKATWSTGGYMFVGHSDSLSGIKANLKQVAPMVYQKTYK